MKSILNAHKTVIIYADGVMSSNPSLRHVDWRRSYSGIQVEAPKSQTYQLEPEQTQVIFNAVRSTTIDGTTTFSLALNPVKESVYRLSFTAGADPSFRTDRNLALTGILVTVTINNNATITFTAGSGTPFSGVLVGDTLFIPGSSTGDSTSPFNVLNVGFWQVIGKTGPTVLTCKRPAGVAFEGAAEAVTPTTNLQLVAFASAGVQVGDKVEIKAGFSKVSQSAYEIQSVTADWIEFTSAAPLPLETGILPAAVGLVIYDTAKKYILVETDQRARIFINGSADGIPVYPIVVDDVLQMGWFEVFGNIYSLSIENRSADVMTANVISCE